MIVSKIIPVDKKRSRVWLDEEFAFVLYKGELRRFKLETGEEIPEKIYSEIMNEILPKRAKLRAMNLLQKRTYSVKQLENKLREGEYPENIIQATLDYVAGYGYTDDRRLCEEYIRIHLNTKSRQRIIMDLTAKGISKDIILQAFDVCSEYGFLPDEMAQAKRLMEKRGFPQGLNSSDFESYEAYRKEYAKQYGFLQRKGYSSDIISKILGGEE